MKPAALFSLALAGMLAAPPLASQPLRPQYPWPHAAADESIAQRFAPPAGFTRISAAPDSFAAWLRGLPLKPGQPAARLFNGKENGLGDAHVAVVDLDVGRRDLQQCADTVIRLRAEYLRHSGRDAQLCFRYTNGEKSRPAAMQIASYPEFRRWLDRVFTFAGTLSLRRESMPVTPAEIALGDFFIRGGSPGHAAMVLDVARNPQGETVFLLGNGFLPAQEMTVLRNPGDNGLSPWFQLRISGTLQIPYYQFSFSDLRRFPEAACTRW